MERKAIYLLKQCFGHIVYLSILCLRHKEILEIRAQYYREDDFIINVLYICAIKEKSTEPIGKK
jgi:hypothetical protein